MKVEDFISPLRRRYGKAFGKKLHALFRELAVAMNRLTAFRKQDA